MGRARKERALEEALARAVAAGIAEGERRSFERTLKTVALEALGLEVRDTLDFIQRAGVRGALPLITEAARTTWPKRYRERLTPVLGALMEHATEGKAPVLGSFTLQNPKMREFLDDYTSHLSETLSETSYEKFEAALREAMDGGLSVPDTRALLEERIPSLNRSRAELIARTETHAAANGASLEQARQSGVVKGKRWLHSGNLRNARPEHVAQNGVIVPINDTFPDGSQYPSAPNCRCTLVYETDHEALRGRVT